MKIIFSILILFSGCHLALACSCAVPTDKSKSEALRRSSVVFRGKVISIDSIPAASENKVSFQIESAWKGVRENKVVVTTASESAACGFSFEKDKIYTVYAGGNPASTGSCLMLQVDEKLIREAFGEGTKFETPSSQTDTSESLWSRFWRKIASLFS